MKTPAPWLRRVVVAVLGVVLIIDSLGNQFRVLEFIVGLVMLGLVPIDSVIDLLMKPKDDEEQIKRLQDVMKKKKDNGKDGQKGGGT